MNTLCNSNNLGLNLKKLQLTQLFCSPLLISQIFYNSMIDQIIVTVKYQLTFRQPHNLNRRSEAFYTYIYLNLIVYPYEMPLSYNQRVDVSVTLRFKMSAGRQTCFLYSVILGLKYLCAFHYRARQAQLVSCKIN